MYALVWRCPDDQPQELNASETCALAHNPLPPYSHEFAPPLPTLMSLQANTAVLLCTDVAARGLDFPDVTTIVQYDVPSGAEE